jgi:DNA polymerase III subunit epsilon
VLHQAYLADIEKAAKGPSVWSKISQATEEPAV